MTSEIKFDMEMTKEKPVILDEIDTRFFAALWTANGTLTDQQRSELGTYINITYR